jgi:hypothetical protein
MRASFPRDHAHPVRIVVALALLLVVVAGCGQGEYDRRLEASVAVLQQAGKFSDLERDPRPVFETPFTIRMPFAFGLLFTTSSTKPGSNDTFTSDELQPPFVKLPGIRFLRQGGASADGRTSLPYFYYVAGYRPDTQVAPPPAAEEAKPADGASEAPKPKPAAAVDPELESIRKTLLDAFPDEKDLAWEPVSCTTPRGNGRAEWQRLKVHGPQHFEFFGNPESGQTLPGTFELWAYDQNGWRILIGWRAPDALVDKAPIEKWAALAAGTIQQQQQ